MKTCIIIMCLVAVGSAVNGEDVLIKMIRLSEVSTDFSQRLHQKLLVSDSNCIFSGYSIFITLCNLVYGARNSTVIEMYNTTQIYRFTGGEMKPHEANSIVLGQYRTNKTGGNASYAIYISLNPGTPVTINFDNFTKTNYQSEVAYHNLSYAPGPQQRINDYCKNKTGGVITDIVPPGVINSSTQIILASTFQLSALWAKPFTKNKTQKANFTLPTGGKTLVDMMFDDYREAAYLNDNGTVVTELPFLNKTYSAVFVLPPVNRTLADEEKSLAEPGKFLQLLKKLDNTTGTQLFQQPHHVQISIPKFHIKTTFEVSNALKAMGMIAAFDPTQAKFPGLSKRGVPYVEKYYHTVDMQINENGTAEIPVATPQNQPHFGTASSTVQFNRPFLFFFRHRDRNIILFQGRFVGK